MKFAGGILLESKKKAVITASVILLTLVIVGFILFPIIKNRSDSRFLNEDLKDVDSISLIAHCAEIDEKPDSVAGFKESVRLGADGVIIDLCFKKDGTPVMNNDYSSADNAEALEELFAAMNEEKFNDVTVFLRLVQLTDISELNRLAVDYNVIDRLFIIGIDSEHYGIIDTDDTIIPLLLDYDFSDSELTEAENGTLKLPSVLEEYGASGLIVAHSQLSAELIDALNDYGVLVMTDEISDNADFCNALLNGAHYVSVEDVEKSDTLLNKWIEKMQERYQASVEKSIKALSKESREK